MKQRVMIDEPSMLTWQSVLDLLKANEPEGFTNQEIAEAFQTDYQRVSSLTRVMFEARALSKMHVGKTAGTTFYFLPIVEEVEQ